MIGNESNKVRYTVLSTTPIGSGYSIPFTYFDASQISVVITSSEGVESTVDNLNYTVTAPGDSGKLTFVSGYMFPSGTKVLTIVRTITNEQQTDLRNGDVLDAEVLERMFDLIVGTMQELREILARTVRIPISDPVSDLQIPSSQVRANMLLGFDSSGGIIPVLTTDIEQKLAQALAAENSVESMYNDAGMTAVRTDMAVPATSKIQAVANNKANIDIVGADIDNVNDVGNNITKVIAVADNETNINAVNANKSNVDTVATDLKLGASSKVKIVAEDKTNIDAVANNLPNIQAVNNNKTNIDAIATDLALGGSSNVKKVGGSIVDVNAVGSNITKVSSVEAKLTEITAVFAKLSEIDDVSDNMAAVLSAYTNIAAILAAPTQASNAANAKTAAEAARDKAKDWAEKAEDVAVEPGMYSAKHHALKAAASAVAAHDEVTASRRITIKGTLFQYEHVYENGHIVTKFTEVI